MLHKLQLLDSEQANSFKHKEFRSVGSRKMRRFAEETINFRARNGVHKKKNPFV